MTAKSLNNYSFKNGLRIISQNRKFAIVTSILQLLGIPLMMLTALIHLYEEELYKNDSRYTYGFEVWPYISIGSFCLSIAVLLGMFCGIRAFEEAWSKQKVDMLYSLPLSGKQRFFSDYAGGLCMYLIPYFVSVLLGWFILLIMTPLLRGVNAMNSADLSEAYQYYLLLSAGLGALMWLYYSISALTASCCGTLFENIYTNLLLNLLIPGTFAAVLARITSEISGISFSNSWDFIGYTSPVGGLIYLIYMIAENGEYMDYYSSSTWTGSAGTRSDVGLIPAYLRWFAVILILSVLITILAWKLYEHRKAEHVGKPFVYVWIYYVILTAVTVCILCLLDEIESFVPVLIFSSIVYFIMEVIRKRGFKKFWLSIVTYIATVAGAVALFILAVQTNGFGRTNYIPPALTVSTAEITFETPSESSNNFDYHLIYSDKDTISKLEEFHRDYLKNHDSRMTALAELYSEYGELEFSEYSIDAFDGYTYTPHDTRWYGRERYDFTISYHTIAGTTIHRSYWLLQDEYLSLMNVCFGTDLYAEANGSLLENRIRRYTPTSKKNDVFVTPVEVEVSSDNGQQTIHIPDAETNIRLLAGCYQNDLASLSFENYCKDEIICYIESMPVYAGCSQTIAKLKEWGFAEFSTAEELFQGISDYYSSVSVRIYAPEQYHALSMEYPSNTFSSDNDEYLFKENCAYADVLSVQFIQNFSEFKKSYPDICELLGRARKHYISTGNCYLLTVNDEFYLIPEEYSDLVQKVISNGSYYYLSRVFGGSGNDINI